MKRILIALTFISTAVSLGFKNADTEALAAEKNVKLTVNYTFAGIVEGYDHLNKTEVYIDGTLAGTSTVRKESESNTVICETTKAKHNVKILNYAYYEGEWELHTIENNYSIDCTWEGEVNCKKKNNKLNIVFDLDSGTRKEK